MKGLAEIIKAVEEEARKPIEQRLGGPVDDLVDYIYRHAKERFDVGYEMGKRHGSGGITAVRGSLIVQNDRGELL